MITIARCGGLAALAALTMLCACRGPESVSSPEVPHSQEATSAHEDRSGRIVLGVRMGPPGRALSEALQVDPDATTIINNVAPDTPAARSGLERWDLVTAVNGSEDASPAALRSARDRSLPGDVLVLEVLRRGRLETVEIVLAEADPD